MPTERATNRSHDLYALNFKGRRFHNSASVVTYIVTWMLKRGSAGGWRTCESKPTTDLGEALKKYEARKEHAIFVELHRYDDEDSLSIDRRFCNLRRYREVATCWEWVLRAASPPYEIADEQAAQQQGGAE